jgi:hypothetical protein
VVLTTFCRSTSSPQVVAEIEAADAWSNGADGQILLALSPDSMVFDVVPRS